MSLGRLKRTSRPQGGGARSAAWPALAGTALGIAGSLAATWLNNHLADERDQKLRFRSERRELYVQVVHAVKEQAHQFILEVYGPKRTVVQYRPSDSKLYEQLDLISSSETLGATNKFLQDCSFSQKEIREKTPIPSEMKEKRSRTCVDAYGKLIDALRKDLGG
jgi:hypothetical protein